MATLAWTSACVYCVSPNIICILLREMNVIWYFSFSIENGDVRVMCAILFYRFAVVVVVLSLRAVCLKKRNIFAEIASEKCTLVRVTVFLLCAIVENQLGAPFAPRFSQEQRPSSTPEIVFLFAWPPQNTHIRIRLNAFCSPYSCLNRMIFRRGSEKGIWIDSHMFRVSIWMGVIVWLFLH